MPYYSLLQWLGLISIANLLARLTEEHCLEALVKNLKVTFQESLKKIYAVFPVHVGLCSVTMKFIKILFDFITG